MLILVGAATVIAQQSGYELSVETQYLQYYQAEKVYTYGILTKGGVGVPDAGISLTYIDPNLVSHGVPLALRTDKEGKFSYTYDLDKDAALGRWIVEAVCYNLPVPAPVPVKATNKFEVVSKTIVVEANGPYQGIVGQPVEFTGSVTGGKIPYTWYWEFGDGGFSYQQNPTYKYISAGVYTAKLTVKDHGGIQGNDTALVKITPPPNNPPSKPTITGPTNGNVGVEYDYTIVATDPDTDDTVSYYIEWGDGTNSGWTDLTASGDPIHVKHTWTTSETFTVKAKAKDIHELEGPWSDELNVQITPPPNNPPSKPTITGPTNGNVGAEYDYTIVATDPDTGDTVSYYIEWGDGTNSGWTDFSASGDPIHVKHTWTTSETFTVKAKAKDIHELEGPWSDELNVHITPATTTLQVTGKGGMGITLTINNTGNIEAKNVKLNLSIKGGIIIIPKARTIQGRADSMGIGKAFSSQTTIFGIGKIQITGDIKADNAPTITVQAQAFIFGPFALGFKFVE